MEEKDFLIWLNEIGVRDKVATDLLENFGSYSDIFYNKNKWLGKVKVPIHSDKLRAYSSVGSLKTISELYLKKGIEIVTSFDAEYPTEWKGWDDMPKVVYIKGNKQLLSSPGIAVVGSRNASSLGLLNSKLVVKIFVENGVPIVSGLAKGVDAVAHKETLLYKGHTIAVLAHGLDRIYPTENTGLANEIVKSNGMLLSEIPLSEQIQKEYFVQRNRIIVGLSQAVVVVEAGEKSGTVSSAHWAMEMGRELFCISGSPGCEMLIAEGARRLDMSKKTS
jgi:DNA processing protein